MTEKEARKLGSDAAAEGLPRVTPIFLFSLFGRNLCPAWIAGYDAEMSYQKRQMVMAGLFETDTARQ